MLIHWVDGFYGAIPPPTVKRGATVEDTISHLPKVKAVLRTAAAAGAARAGGLLALEQAKHPGTSSWIQLQAGKLDYGVHLFSRNGWLGALSIEYGHTGSGAGGRVAPFQVLGKRYEGKFVLHRAFGMRRRS